MRTIAKYLIGLLVALALLLLALVLVGRLLAEQRLHRVVQVNVTPVPYATGATVVERGRYLYESRSCANCHGLDGAGRVFERKGDDFVLAGPNLTPTGVTARYTEVDWVRSIRHGVAPGGRPLQIMPSEDYDRLNDGDLAAIVAYLRQLPGKAGGEARTRLPLIATVAYGFRLFPDAADRIDHAAAPPPPAVPEAVSVEHGAYVAQLCRGCHGPGLAGGKLPGHPPDWPPAARLAGGAGSVMSRYPDAQSLIALFRTGRRPDGTPVAVMPTESLGKMSEVDVRALHLYLSGLRGTP